MSSRSPAMDAGTAGHRDSVRGPLVRRPGKPQNAASAAPASRDGNSPHLAAAKLTDDASPPPPPSVTESAGKPPGVSAAAIQCRSASRSAAGLAVFNRRNNRAPRGDPHRARRVQHQQPDSPLGLHLGLGPRQVRAVVAEQRGEAQRENLGVVGAELGHRLRVKVRRVRLDRVGPHPSFVASLAASSSTADAVATMNSDIAPSARCDGFAAPALAAAATALTSDPAPPANPVRRDRRNENAEAVLTVAVLAVLDPTLERSRDVYGEGIGQVRQPRAERVRDPLLDVALRLRPERTRQRGARLASHQPHKRIVRTVAPVVVVRVAARRSSQPRDGTDRREEPRARLPLLRPSLRIPELGDDGVEVPLAATAAPALATAATHATATALRRVSTCLTCASTQSLIASSPAWASRLARGAWASMEATAARTASGDRRSCLQLCATAPSANSAGLIVATSRWNKGAEPRGRWLGLGVAAQDHAGVRVHRARSHLGDHLRG